MVIGDVAPALEGHDVTEQWTANQHAWQSEMEQHGKVIIRSSFGSMTWRVGFAVALVAVFVYGRYSSGDIGQRGLTLAIAGFALLLIACIVFVRMFYGGKSIAVTTDGITMMDGSAHAWSDIRQVAVYSPMKSPPMVSMSLTESAWESHMGKQNTAAKLMHQGNKLVLRDRSVVLPSYLAANPAELAPWLNQFARGDAEVSR